MHNNPKLARNINLNPIFYQLNSKSQNYICDIINITRRKIGLNSVSSIILFGSQIYNKKENILVSDCDLLIILNDNISKCKIKDLDRYILALEIKHNYRDNNPKLLKRILSYLQKTTGMFVSHFITTKKYCKKQLFHKIFQINHLFSFLFAPRKIVLNSVMSNNKEIYGESLINFIKKENTPSKWDIFKSLLMNLIISFFSIIITPFRKLNAIYYQLEAVKWSLKAVNYYIFRDSKSLNEIIIRFSNDKNNCLIRINMHYLKRFLRLRKQPFNDIRFIIRSPIKIIKIHKVAFNYLLK